MIKRPERSPGSSPKKVLTFLHPLDTLRTVVYCIDSERAIKPATPHRSEMMTTLAQHVAKAAESMGHPTESLAGLSERDYTKILHAAIPEPIKLIYDEESYTEVMSLDWYNGKIRVKGDDGETIGLASPMAAWAELFRDIPSGAFLSGMSIR